MSAAIDILEFFVFWFAIYFPAALTVFGITGTWLTWLNRKHPDRRIQNRKGEHRIREDIKNSIVEIAVTSTLVSLGLALRDAGFVVAEPFTGPVAIVIGFVALMVAYDAWFYWTHRLLHTKWFYRFHAPHHRAVAPTAWSNDAGSSMDTLIAHSFFVLAATLTPVPLLSILAIRLFDQVTGMIGHCGFEHFAGPTMRRPFPMITTIYHDQHHSAFRYNYANYFSWWDRLMGTVHPKYDELVREREMRLLGTAPAGDATDGGKAAR